MSQTQKILVVDDERFNINVLVDLLKPNYKMMAAKNGAQALKAARSGNPPSLILLDVMMPEMDGYEVCRQLKDDEKTRDIPVIFVTAMGHEADEEKGFSVGAVDYITKPIKASIVEARVKTQMALQQSAADLGQSLKAQEEQNALLAETEERTRLLLESVGEGVFGVDTKGEIAFANPQCSAQLGYSEEELLGSDAHVLFHHSYLDDSSYPVEECWMYKSFTEGKSYRIDNESFWRKDGTSFPVEYNSTPIVRGEELVGAVITFNDISERLAAQRERDEALEVISGSITYATNIQHSILPQKKCLEAVTSQYCILWEPRDQVGGDMYWCKPWGLGKLLALGDCTGHGVPGAFMTLIANGAIEMATMETMPGDTGTLLQRIHQLIQKELNQHQQGGTSDDGLELGVCYIDHKKEKMIYSGARFPLFHIDNGEASEIKGDKKGIGYRGIPCDVPFGTHEVELVDSRTFYMVSDGLIDQIGGEKRRGFGKRRFKSLLCEIEELPLEEQRERIWQALVEYQGDERRRDDVSMIGFKL